MNPRSHCSKSLSPRLSAWVRSMTLPLLMAGCGGGIIGTGGDIDNATVILSSSGNSSVTTDGTASPDDMLPHGEDSADSTTTVTGRYTNLVAAGNRNEALLTIVHAITGLDSEILLSTDVDNTNPLVQPALGIAFGGQATITLGADVDHDVDIYRSQTIGSETIDRALVTLSPFRGVPGSITTLVLRGIPGDSRTPTEALLLEESSRDTNGFPRLRFIDAATGFRSDGDFDLLLTHLGTGDMIRFDTSLWSYAEPNTGFKTMTSGLHRIAVIEHSSDQLVAELGTIEIGSDESLSVVVIDDSASTNRPALGIVTIRN